MAGKPYSKQEQLARSPAGVGMPKRRYPGKPGRVYATPEEWREIVRAKQGPCRCAELEPCAGSIEYHHVRSRGQGGGDTPDNIVPLCTRHHSQVTARQKGPVRVLLASLTDAEYQAALDAGEDFFEQHYRLRYDRSAS